MSALPYFCFRCGALDREGAVKHRCALEAVERRDRIKVSLMRDAIRKPKPKKAKR